MTERGIPFSAQMVRHLLAGIKTQTRRALSTQPTSEPCGSYASLTQSGSRPVFAAMWSTPSPDGSTVCLCRYGVPGDVLWVRESWRASAEADGIKPRDMNAAHRIRYEADGPHEPGFGRLRPGMFMPRWASRISLKVTEVRVQRLLDISAADAWAEGVPQSNVDPVPAYQEVWETINGAGSWQANPWVWALSFERVSQPLAPATIPTTDSVIAAKTLVEPQSC